jgi:DHA3 family macrolide efflux protein-like MFS transporter
MSSVGTAMVPLGLMIAGPISDQFSIQSWFLMGGIVCILMAIVALSVPAVVNLENKKDEPNKAATNIVFELN